jgi:hypothetical protein
MWTAASAPDGAVMPGRSKKHAKPGMSSLPAVITWLTNRGHAGSMHDPSSLRSKAESSLRLAELAKTPRARQLFRELADEYERRAQGELIAELSEVAPPLVPAAVPAADAPIVADAPPSAAGVPAVPDAPAAVPLAPTDSESDQFLAGLKALREETSRD